LKKVNVILGKAEDAGGVDFTRVSIQDTLTGQYYNGSSFGSVTEQWLNTVSVGAGSSLVRWSYTAPVWTEGHTYTIRSRATDLAGNEEHTDAITFKYDTVNGLEGSLYLSNPAVNNNSDYKIYYPNTVAVPLNGYVEVDFADSFRFSPWMEDSDISLTDQGGGITASADAIDRVNKVLTSTVTAGSVGTNDMLELEINNLRIHNPSLIGDYPLSIKIYDQFDALLESGTGTITLVQPYQQVELNVDIAQSLQVSVDSGAVMLSVDPDVQLGQNWNGTGGVVSEKTDLTVKTNAQSGYSLLIKLAGRTATGSAVLDGTTNTGNSITSSNGDRVATENNFAFALASGSALTVTAFTNADTPISGAGISNPTNSNTESIYYYLNVDYTTPSDVYQGTVTYTAVGAF
jgi:hypothetical protein